MSKDIRLDRYPVEAPQDSYASCKKWGSIIAIAIGSIVALGAILLVVAHNGHDLGPFSQLATVIEYKWACLTLPLASAVTAIAFYFLLNLKPPQKTLKEVPTTEIRPEDPPSEVVSITPPVTYSPATSQHSTSTQTDQINEVAEVLFHSNLDVDDIGAQLLDLLKND